MEWYLVLKYLHILAAVVVTGTGAGIAFFMLMAYRAGNLQALYFTAKHVVLADWLFTTPAVITQIVTGVLLMQQLGYTFNSAWFYWVAGLVVLIGACWLPVLKIQYRLRALAEQDREQSEISAEFKRLMRIWIALGIPAFITILAVFYLMIFKPVAVV